MTLASEFSVAGWTMTAVFGLLALSLLCGFLRLAKGPTLPDRVVALDNMGMVVIGTVGAFSMQVGQPVYLDAAIVVALLTFLSTVGFAHYLELSTFHKKEPPDA